MVAENISQSKSGQSLESVKNIDALRTSGFDHLGDQGIPTLDLAWAFSSDDHKRQSAEELEAVMRNVGIFLVENHGVDLDLRERLNAAARKFFCLPEELKRKYPVDDTFPGYLGLHRPGNCTNEVFVSPIWLDNNNSTSWPEEVPELKTLILSWIEELREIGYKLNRLIALRVGYEHDEEFFNREYFGNDRRYPVNDRLRITLYHQDLISKTAKDPFGMDAHSDFGWLTVLSAGDNPGLQVFSKKGEWIEPEVRKDQLIVSLGDFMKRLTNNSYNSCLRRVHINKDNEPISVCWFFNPLNEITGSVFPHFVKDGEEPKYPPIEFGKYIEDQRKNFYNLQWARLYNYFG
eukprot:Clim_evm3s102 gene=Clim_evmTU3s102